MGMGVRFFKKIINFGTNLRVRLLMNIVHNYTLKSLRDMSNTCEGLISVFLTKLKYYSP